MNVNNLFRYAIPGYITGVVVAKNAAEAKKQVIGYMEAYHSQLKAAAEVIEIWSVKADETYDNEFMVCECGY